VRTAHWRSQYETDREVADRCHVVRWCSSDHVVGGWRGSYADVLPRSLQGRALKVRAESSLAVVQRAS